MGMKYIYSLSGGVAQKKRYTAGVSFTNAGVPVEAPATTDAGMGLPTSAAAVTDCVGFSLDTATYSTTQSTTGADIESLLTVVVNPDAIMRCRLAGGTTTGTALQIYTVDTANSAGTTVDTDTSATNHLDGVIWGFSGTNAGQKRKITAVSGNNFTVTVPFLGIVVGDVFLAYPGGPGHINGTARDQIELTTDFQEANANAAWTAEADLFIVDHELRDSSGGGRANSYIHIGSADHVFSGVVT